MLVRSTFFHLSLLELPFCLKLLSSWLTAGYATTVKGAVPKAGLSPNDNSEPWTVLVHKKPQAGWIPYNPKTMRPPPLTKDTRALKILSWNVNGLKALLKSRGFSVQQLAEREDFDVLCLQETKMQARFELCSLCSLDMAPFILSESFPDDTFIIFAFVVQEKDVEVIKDTLLDGYTNSFWTCSVSKLGYSGTAIISRVCITCLMLHAYN